MDARGKSDERTFGLAEWIAWLGMFVGATAFAYQNFETKQDASERKADMIQRLDRLEGKVDQLIERGD